LTDEERIRLARLGKVLGRKLLSKVATIVTPDTILAWHRKFYPASRIIPRGVGLVRGSPTEAQMLSLGSG